jgi:hypothetical protein
MDYFYQSFQLHAISLIAASVLHLGLRSSCVGIDYNGTMENTSPSIISLSSRSSSIE